MTTVLSKACRAGARTARAWAARALTMGTTVAALAGCQPAQPKHERRWVPIMARDSVDAIDIFSVYWFASRSFRATIRNGGGEHDVTVDCATGVISERDMPQLYAPPLASAYCEKAGR